MQLTLAGNQLRPFIFFKSSGDLMSLYWSGALDNKNTAIQVEEMSYRGRKEYPVQSSLQFEIEISRPSAPDNLRWDIWRPEIWHAGQ